ncbi:MAG: hypothetical protein HFE41_00335 [Clostridia bacterium]|jgi:hypothetical protein|nr:hypothetical protein [Clostridia bacterium]
MKNKKVVLVIAAVLTALICTVITAGFSCSFFNKTTITDVAKRLKDDWGVILPENAELLYTASEMGFPGDGEVFYVIKLEKEPVEYNLSVQRDKFFESEYDKWFNFLIKNSSDEMPNEYVHDWETEYLWKCITAPVSSNFLNMIYYPEKSELYVLIVFM